MTESSELSWPKRGDRPFIGEGEKAFLCHLDWIGVLDNDDFIAWGYKDAADMVVAGLSKREERVHPDRLFFPVLFLYRHSIELMFKCLLRAGSQLGLVSLSENDIAGHNLHKLWNKVRIALEAYWPNADTEDIDVVESVVLQLHSIDSTGQAFRYARDRSNARHLKHAPKKIDLLNLRAVMAGVLNLLEGCEMAFDAEVEKRSGQ